MTLSADLIFSGGTIHTGLETLPPGSAIAIKSGRILAVDRAAELSRLEARQRIDLQGRTVIPGLIDAHNHLSWYAMLLRYVDCRVPLNGSLFTALVRIQDRAQELRPGEWIRGWGFADYKVSERRFPTLAEMDESAPDHPVIIIHASGHSAVMNSLALQTVGFDEHTPDPPGGKIERDAHTGQLTGVLHETAMVQFSMDSMFKEFLALGLEQQVAILEQGTQEYARLGITTACDASVMPPLLSCYQEAARLGRLNCRITAMPFYDWSRPVIDSGLRTGFGSGWMKLGPVKLISDGSLSGRTAAVSQPYQGTQDLGILYYPQEKLDQIVRELDARDLQIAIHAIGDRAVEQVLLAYEKVTGGGNPHRHRMEHAGIVSHQLVQKMVDTNLVIATQPRMLYEQGDGFYRSCGEERIHRVYPYKTFIESGLHTAGSSDCPVVSPDPLLGMRDAVLRQTEEGRVLAPEQRLAPEQALYMFTQDAAWSLFDEREKGTLQEGRLADLLVLSADPLALPAEQWEEQMHVEMTVIDGRIIYQAEEMTEAAVAAG
jgi:predicted amidohydrolase YtcJ